MNYILTAAIFVLGTLVLSSDAVCKADLNDLEQIILDEHNKVRRLHTDTPDLCYGESGEDISFHSQDWANVIAKDGDMQHSTSTDFYVRTNPYGENMYMSGSSSAFPANYASYVKGTESWYAEIDSWNFETSSKESTTAVTGHFTQVVWKSTEQVNCGYSTYEDNFKRAYVVCQYYPAGNYQTQYVENVKPLIEEEEEGEEEEELDMCDWMWQEKERECSLNAAGKCVQMGSVSCIANDTCSGTCNPQFKPDEYKECTSCTDDEDEEEEEHFDKDSTDDNGNDDNGNDDGDDGDDGDDDYDCSDMNDMDCWASSASGLSQFGVIFTLLIAARNLLN